MVSDAEKSGRQKGQIQGIVIFAENRSLFSNLELAGFNHGALFIANLEDINTPIKISKRNVDFLLGNFKFYNFFADKVEDNEAV